MRKFAVHAAVVAAALSTGCASHEEARFEGQGDALRAMSDYVAGVWEADAGALPGGEEGGRLTMLPTHLRRDDATNEATSYAVIQPEEEQASVLPYVLNASAAPASPIQLWIGDARYEIDGASEPGELTLVPITPGAGGAAGPVTLRAVEGAPTMGSPGPAPARDPAVHRRAFGQR